jgi:medium-chain acyl-[acyl-carrier-protein] hydrolase
MYSYKKRVSFSEIGKEGIVPYYGILYNLQDCSTFQSEDLGIGISYLKKHHRAWVLLAYKIQIFKDLRFGEEVEVGTSPLNFDKVMATRQFWIKDANGGYIVKAESIWSLLDTENRMPVRITEGDISKYQLGEAFDSLKVSRKLKFQGEREVLGTTKVFKSFIDTNGHLNNADYMRIVEQFLPKGKKYNQIEIVYKKEALIDEEIVCVAYNNQDYLGINLESADGQIHGQIKLKNI